MNNSRRPFVKELNPHLICILCGGYFIDATTVVECLHTFCKSCIIRYLETSKFCPTCDVLVHKNDPLFGVKADKILQDLVFKIVPKLYKDEVCRKKKYSARNLDKCAVTGNNERNNLIDHSYILPEDVISVALKPTQSSEEVLEIDTTLLTRFFNCPAAVQVFQLKKLLRGKFDLPKSHPIVFVTPQNETLKERYSLVDIAYILSWKKDGPLVIYYKICFSKRIKFDPEVVNRRLVFEPKNHHSTNELVADNEMPKLEPQTDMEPYFMPENRTIPLLSPIKIEDDFASPPKTDPNSSPLMLFRNRKIKKEPDSNFSKLVDVKPTLPIYKAIVPAPLKVPDSPWNVNSLQVPTLDSLSSGSNCISYGLNILGAQPRLNGILQSTNFMNSNSLNGALLPYGLTLSPNLIYSAFPDQSSLNGLNLYAVNNPASKLILPVPNLETSVVQSGSQVPISSILPTKSENSLKDGKKHKPIKPKEDTSKSKMEEKEVQLMISESGVMLVSGGNATSDQLEEVLNPVQSEANDLLSKIESESMIHCSENDSEDSSKSEESESQEKLDQIKQEISSILDTLSQDQKIHKPSKNETKNTSAHIGISKDSTLTLVSKSEILNINNNIVSSKILNTKNTLEESLIINKPSMPKILAKNKSSAAKKDCKINRSKSADKRTASNCVEIPIQEPLHPTKDQQISIEGSKSPMEKIFDESLLKVSSNSEAAIELPLNTKSLCSSTKEAALSEKMFSKSEVETNKSATSGCMKEVAEKNLILKEPNKQNLLGKQSLTSKKVSSDSQRTHKSANTSDNSNILTSSSTPTIKTSINSVNDSDKTGLISPPTIKTSSCTNESNKKLSTGTGTTKDTILTSNLKISHLPSINTSVCSNSDLGNDDLKFVDVVVSSTGGSSAATGMPIVTSKAASSDSCSQRKGGKTLASALVTPTKNSIEKAGGSVKNKLVSPVKEEHKFKPKKVQPLRYKTLKNSPKGWNPTISREKLPLRITSSTSPKTNKFFKARNSANVSESIQKLAISQSNNTIDNNNMMKSDSKILAFNSCEPSSTTCNTATLISSTTSASVNEAPIVSCITAVQLTDDSCKISSEKSLQNKISSLKSTPTKQIVSNEDQSDKIDIESPKKKIRISHSISPKSQISDINSTTSPKSKKTESHDAFKLNSNRCDASVPIASSASDNSLIQSASTKDSSKLVDSTKKVLVSSSNKSQLVNGEPSNPFAVPNFSVPFDSCKEVLQFPSGSELMTSHLDPLSCLPFIGSSQAFMQSLASGQYQSMGSCPSIVQNLVGSSDFLSPTVNAQTKGKNASPIKNSAENVKCSGKTALHHGSQAAISKTGVCAVTLKSDSSIKDSQISHLTPKKDKLICPSQNETSKLKISPVTKTSTTISNKDNAVINKKCDSSVSSLSDSVKVSSVTNNEEASKAKSCEKLTENITNKIGELNHSIPVATSSPKECSSNTENGVNSIESSYSVAASSQKLDPVALFPASFESLALGLLETLDSDNNVSGPSHSDVMTSTLFSNSLASSPFTASLSSTTDTNIGCQSLSKDLNKLNESSCPLSHPVTSSFDQLPEIYSYSAHGNQDNLKVNSSSAVDSSQISLLNSLASLVNATSKPIPTYSNSNTKCSLSCSLPVVSSEVCKKKAQSVDQVKEDNPATKVNIVSTSSCHHSQSLNESLSTGCRTKSFSEHNNTHNTVFTNSNKSTLDSIGELNKLFFQTEKVINAENTINNETRHNISAVQSGNETMHATDSFISSSTSLNEVLKGSQSATSTMAPLISDKEGKSKSVVISQKESTTVKASKNSVMSASAGSSLPSSSTNVTCSVSQQISSLNASSTCKIQNAASSVHSSHIPNQNGMIQSSSNNVLFTRYNQMSSSASSSIPSTSVSKKLQQTSTSVVNSGNSTHASSKTNGPQVSSYQFPALSFNSMANTATEAMPCFTTASSSSTSNSYKNSSQLSWDSNALNPFLFNSSAASFGMTNRSYPINSNYCSQQNSFGKDSTTHANSNFMAMTNAQMATKSPGMSAQYDASSTAKKAASGDNFNNNFNHSHSSLHNSGYNNNYMNFFSTTQAATPSLTSLVSGSGYNFPLTNSKFTGSQQYFNFGQNSSNNAYFAPSNFNSGTTNYQNCMNQSSGTNSSGTNMNSNFGNNFSGSFCNFPLSYYPNSSFYNSYPYFYQGGDMGLLSNHAAASLMPSFPSRSSLSPRNASASQSLNDFHLQSSLFPMMPFVSPLSGNPSRATPSPMGMPLSMRSFGSNASSYHQKMPYQSDSSKNASSATPKTSTHGGKKNATSSKKTSTSNNSNTSVAKSAAMKTHNEQLLTNAGSSNKSSGVPSHAPLTSVVSHKR